MIKLLNGNYDMIIIMIKWLGILRLKYDGYDDLSVVLL